MTVKTITVTEEAYKALRRIKREDESFSEVILRVTKNKIDLRRYSGIISENRAEELKVHVKRVRERASEDLRRRIKHVHS